MVNEEVEDILAEIRARVRSRELSAREPGPEIDHPTWEDRSEPSFVSVVSRGSVETSANEAMARLDSYLAVTARAWDRLPPLASNRSGSTARLELWVKRQIKRATHWFTWEQINFNAAVHHALRDSLQALSGLERALERLRVETDTQRTALEQSQETLKVELQTQRDEFLKYSAMNSRRE